MRKTSLTLWLAGVFFVASAPVFAIGDTGTVDPTDEVEPASSFLPTSDTAASLRQEINLQAARASERKAVRSLVVTAIGGHFDNGHMVGTAAKYTDISRPGHDFDLSFGTWRSESDYGSSTTGFAVGGRTTLVPLTSNGRQISITGYIDHSKWSHMNQLFLAMDQRILPSLTFTGNLGAVTRSADWAIKPVDLATAIGLSYQFKAASIGAEYIRIGGGEDNTTLTVAAKVRVGRLGIAKFGRTDDGVYSFSFGQQFDLGYAAGPISAR